MTRLILAIALAVTTSTSFAAATTASAVAPTDSKSKVVGYVTKSSGVLRVKGTPPQTPSTQARYCYLDGNLNPTSTCFSTAAKCLERANVCGVVD